MIRNNKYLTVSVGQEFRTDLTGRFWLRVSHEISIKIVPGLQSPEGSTGTGGSTSELTHMAVGSSPQPMGLSIGQLE